MAKEKKFEDYLNGIEEIVDRLESGEAGLEDSIKQYEKGMELIKKCREILSKTKLKIEKLKKETPAAKGEEEAYEEVDGLAVDPEVKQKVDKDEDELF